MADGFKGFVQNNIAEFILGLAVGLVAALLMDLNFQESLTIIVLAPLIAIILNQLLQVFVTNQKNQRTALIIVALIGSFFLFQQFQLGIFSVQNINNQEFDVEVEPQISAAMLGGIGKIIGGAAKLPTLIILVILMIGLFIFNPILGTIVFLIIGIPAFFVIKTVLENFQLILILGAMYAFVSLIFKSRIRQRALAVK